MTTNNTRTPPLLIVGEFLFVVFMFLGLVWTIYGWEHRTLNSSNPGFRMILCGFLAFASVTVCYAFAKETKPLPPHS